MSNILQHRILLAVILILVAVVVLSIIWHIIKRIITDYCNEKEVNRTLENNRRKFK